MSPICVFALPSEILVSWPFPWETTDPNTVVSSATRGLNQTGLSTVSTPASQRDSLTSMTRGGSAML
ncbi:MAG: hypothetical protein AB7Q45_27295, partial [Planctomycetaceae bacterium]